MMNWLPRGIWRYAILVVLLLVIAGVASRETISSITALLEAKEPANDALIVRIVTIPVLALTMGFLFLAGALGVWAIRSTAVIEGRRRVGRFVDAMDYLRDGIVAVDLEGRINGMNPAARDMAESEMPADAEVAACFPCLTDSDVRTLLSVSEPHEVECVSRRGEDIRALRFRSQPSEDMNLILISDVTGMKSEEMRTRQIARLQLIGRIARGVAHDFNNILCAISGHASLLDRQAGGIEENRESLRAMIRESQRGAALAGQLLALSRTGVKANPCEQLADHVEGAVALLKVGLAAEWQVITDIQGNFAAIGLSDAQVEQVILNLGLLAADELPCAGFVHVRMRPPGKTPLMDVGQEFAAVALVSAYGPEPRASEEHMKMSADTTEGEAGVIQSVVRSMLEEVGGRMDIMVGHGGKHSYRVSFPRLVKSDDRMSALSAVSESLRMQVAEWNLLFAATPSRERSAVEEYLEELGMRVEVAGDIVTALQDVEAGRELDVMIFDKRILGEEADALLRAIRKLRPRAGLVVLSELPDSVPVGLKDSAVFATLDASPETVLQALIQAVEKISAA